MNLMFLRHPRGTVTWLEDHWAAAMAVLATEKALMRLPSGRTTSLRISERPSEPGLDRFVIPLPFEKEPPPPPLNQPELPLRDASGLGQG